MLWHPFQYIGLDRQRNEIYFHLLRRSDKVPRHLALDSLVQGRLRTDWIYLDHFCMYTGSVLSCGMGRL